MGKNSFSDPLLGCSSNGEKGGEEEEGKVKWWRKVMDLKEARRQFFFALPMILTNVSYYFIPLLSVMFAGHLGELQLAAANLANSWATVTGFAFMVGSSGALETLCGQSYGAQQYRSLGIYLQSSCLISAFFSVLISLLWLYSEHILVFLHQDPQIAAAAALYIKHLIPGLFAYGFLNNILRFLQTQSVVMPLVFCSVLPTLLHGGVAYALVYWTSLSFQGAAVAVSVSLWVAVAMLGFYVICGKKFERTWVGFSTESFRHVFKNLTLALPSAAMVCLEYWAFELLVLLAGLMPNPEITTSLIAMCVNTEAISYMFAYGVSAAASTRVSNELGAGNPGRAKHAMAVALELSFLLSLAVVFALALGHNKWAGFFSDTPVIISEYASLTPLLVVSILFDFVQAILSGVARGCGWQHLAVGINLGTFYLIGMIIAALLGFKFKFYAKGLWMGLICGLSCQALGLLLLTHFAKWKKVQFSDSTGSEHNPILV